MSCAYVDIVSVAMAAVDMSKTTHTYVCVFCSVHIVMYKSVTSVLIALHSLPTCVCVFGIPSLFVLASVNTIGLHLIWFMYCIQCTYYTITILLFGIQRMHIPVLSIYTVFILYPALYQNSHF